MADDGAGPSGKAPLEPPPTRLSATRRLNSRSKASSFDDEVVTTSSLESLQSRHQVEGEPSPYDAASQADGSKNDGPWLETLQKEFGWQLLSTIMAAQHMFKGFVNTLVRSNWYYIVKQYSVPATRVSIYEGVVYLPWALKPMIGFISDFFTIGGYAKLPYLLLSALLGTGSLAILGYYQRSLAIGTVVGLLFYVSLAQATTDLLIEAAYARSMREKPQHAPSLTSFVWGGMVVAGMFATLVSGVFLSYGSPWTLYTVSMWPCAFLLIPTLQNWIMEAPMTDSQVQTQRDNIMKQSEALALCLIILVSCIILSYSGLMLSVKMNALVSLMVLILVLVSFSLLLNPIIAKVNAFGLIQTAMNVSLGSAAFFFMLDSPKEYPEGPHFSVPFVSVVLPLVGSVFSIVGIWIYNLHAGHWSYQKMFIIGNLIVLVTSLADVIFFLRWNRLVGLEDHLFVLGSAAFQSVIEEWLWMPNSLILAQLCPRGLEAIMYANLAGCHNLGNSISNSLGALLLEVYHVEPTGSRPEMHQFDNLWLVSLISTLLPLMPVALVPWFIPNKLNTEPILENPAMSINEGSLLGQWLGWASEDIDVADRHSS